MAFAALLADGLLALNEGNIVHPTSERVRNWLYSHKLRAAPEKFKIQAKRSDGQVEEYWMDTDRVPFKALPGNLLERRGRTFLVTSLDPENFIIEAKELTQVIIRTLTVARNTIEEKLSFTRHKKRRIMAGVLLECGNALLEVKPKSLVTVLEGRTMKKELSEEGQRKHTFHLPTHAVSIRFTGEVACRNLFTAAYAWHILEILAHAILRECNRRFGYSLTQFGTKLHREERRILIYDRCLSAKATKTIFTHFVTILKGIIEQLKRCECKFGCQRCTGVFSTYGKKGKLIYNPKQLCKVVVEGLL
ncbi:MAG: Zn-binding domain-containing protein [Candidatus Heimdallarchaeota archaeon]